MGHADNNQGYGFSVISHINEALKSFWTYKCRVPSTLWRPFLERQPKWNKTGKGYGA